MPNEKIPKLCLKLPVSITELDIVYHSSYSLMYVLFTIHKINKSLVTGYKFVIKKTNQ